MVGFVAVKPGQNYVFSKDGVAIQGYVHEYNANQQWVHRSSISGTKIYTVPDGVCFIRWNSDSDGFAPKDTIQLEEGTTATAYEPYILHTEFEYPPQDITALSGTNVLRSDTGNTEVSGRVDPIPVINNILTRMAALEAAVINNT
jgi:hypothetical protein